MTEIGEYAFYKCTALEEIHIDAEIIKSDAFAFCSALSDVTFSNRVREIQSNAFSYCESLTTLPLPEGLETIQSNAFSNSGIVKLDLPDSVTSVNLGGLEGTLKEVRWTVGIPKIPTMAFDEFTALETVVIPEGVTAIASTSNSNCGTFYNCTSLKSVTFPSTMSKIGAYAFYKCTALEEIYFIGAAPTIGGSAFYSVTADAYYPANDPTFTEDVMLDYGGTINWIPYGDAPGGDEPGIDDPTDPTDPTEPGGSEPTDPTTPTEPNEDEQEPKPGTPNENWLLSMADKLEENYFWATTTFMRLRELFY